MEFIDLNVRQLSKEITLIIYKSFKDQKDFGFRDQIQRAAVSIMNNIAEGFERKTLKEKQRFYIIAKGSSGEIRSMIFLAFELGYIAKDIHEQLVEKTYSISKMLQGLINNSKF